MTEQPSRRSFLRHAVQLSALGIGAGIILTACGKSGDKPAAAGGGCDDVSGLAEADKAMRTTQNYVEAAADSAKTCTLCTLYTPAEAGAPCGGCKVVKGPINPKGSCNLFAAKV
jgi:hypothetical protein